jgi:hypothetical protein
MASGDFATWINSDDMLCQNALAEHTSHIGFDSNTVYVGLCIHLDQDSRRISSHRGRVLSLEDLLRIREVWRSRFNPGYIDQPAALFPRALVLSVGGLNADNHFTMDYELWGELLYAGARVQYTEIPFGMFRKHADQKTRNVIDVTESLISTAVKLVGRGEGFSEQTKKEILADLSAYREQYIADCWTRSGRLAKIGLPRAIVNLIREVRATLQKPAI